MPVDFADVDKSDFKDCVDFLDSVSSLDEVQHWKRRSIEFLRLGPHDRVLDIGCGAGQDVIAIANQINAGGWVIGVDLSELMIREAKRRTECLSLPLHFAEGDINALPFDDDTFDAVLIDRLLHVLPYPATAMTEIARVVAPNGRIVASEPDWNTLAIHGGDLELDRKINSFLSGPSMTATGSLLVDYFCSVGLRVFARQQVLFETSDLELASWLFGIETVAAHAMQRHVFCRDQMLGWLRSLQDASLRGEFSAALTGCIVAGEHRAGPGNLHRTISGVSA